MTTWWVRLLNHLGLRHDTLACMRQEDTWCWPAHLGAKTEGECGVSGKVCVIRADGDADCLEVNDHAGVTYPVVVWFDTTNRCLCIKKHGHHPLDALAMGKLLLDMKGVYCAAVSGNETYCRITGINQRADIDKLPDALPLISVLHKLGERIEDHADGR